MKKSQRNWALINPRFQLRLIGWMWITSVLTVAVFYGSLSYFFWSFTQRGVTLGLPSHHVFFEFMREQQVQMNWVFLVTAILVWVVILIIGWVVSHRVAGPLHRLMKHFQDVADGKTINDVTFRTNDYFSEVAESYNRQLSYFRNRTNKDSVE